MKQIIYPFACLLLGCTFTSCSDSSDAIAESNDETIKVVYIEDGSIKTSMSRSNHENGIATLAFRDKNSLETFKNELASKTAEERNGTLRSLGIINLHAVAEQADQELEFIGANAASEEEFRQIYTQYVEKYNGVLIRNYIDNSDLTLYVPDEENIESYIANSANQFVVGDKIITRQAENTLSQRIEETSKAIVNAQSTTSTEVNLNSYVYSPVKHKRVSFTASRKANSIFFSMKVDKKMWYGWKSDGHRKYVIEPYLNNITYNPPRLPVYVSTSAVNANMGTATGTVTGTIYTWTDLTLDCDSNGNEITAPDGFPQRSRDKSKTVTVNLPLTL